MFTIESFCNLVWKTSYSKVLQKVSKSDYMEFSLPKKGGTRTINYLKRESELWELQHQLLCNFLIKQNLPICVKGFRKGESYKTFLSEHIGAKYFLRVDISSFFPSITEAHIKDALSSLLLCNSSDDEDKLLNLICDITTLNGVLPQGACTSPAVSNIVMARLDQRITKYCQVFDVRYTRYADDLLFSSRSLNFSEKKWFLKKVKFILSSQSFRLNYSKIKYGNEKLVLNGYIISNDGICLSRRRLSDIRHVVSFAKSKNEVLEKNGAERFLELANGLPLRYRDLNSSPFKSVFQFVQFLCGYRAFLISMIDLNYQSTPFQKELQRLIKRIERQIIRYS